MIDACVIFPDMSAGPAPLLIALRRIAAAEPLPADLAADVFGAIMAGQATTAQIGALLAGLRARGESADELAGAVRALRAAMIPVPDAPADAVDTCGTGGGVVPTFNISTAAAFVVAGAGVPVAKHGNRSFTSKSGSADVLEALGVRVSLAPAEAGAVLRRAGIVFLFAPDYHPAMRHVGPVRRELGIPTLMNLVGPLANPAGVRRQVVGVAERARAPLVADALARLGAAHALVVHAEAGMDEISPDGPTRIWEVQDGAVREWTLEPARLGVPPVALSALEGGEPAQNASRVQGILSGADDMAGRWAVLLNAAAALYVSGRTTGFPNALAAARDSLQSGAAAQALQLLREATRTSG
jgi:anthranilate phosphoribosyltransferase